MTTREFLIDTAVSKLGNYGKGSPEVIAIWRDVLSPALSDQQVKVFAQTSEWCGAFVLNCLREAKITPDLHWKIGSGFVLPLLAKHVTKTPQPGDIGIRAGAPGHEVWHHFLVERWNGPGDWDSIDGNSPTAARHHHTSLDSTITFYDISSLLPALPEGGFVRGQPFSVPGIEDK